MTGNRATVVQDYLVMWVSGRIALARHVEALATTSSYNAWIARLVGPGVDTYYWLYPPQILLLATPLAAFPLLASFVAWSVLTSVLLWFVLRAVAIPVAARIAVLLSPAALESLVDGQNGALISAAMIGGLSMSARSPCLAGMLLSVLALKPQLALVSPVCLIAARHWRAAGWTVVFGLGWFVASVSWFGTGPWIDYVRSIMPEAKAVHLGLDSVRFGALYLQNLVVTPYATLRGLGVRAVVAQGAQLLVSVAVLVSVWRLWSPRHDAPRTQKLAFALAAMPLVTPYAMTYDMIGVALACALLATGRRMTRVEMYAALLAWVWPGLSLYVGILVQPGLGALVFGAFALVVWRADFTADGVTHDLGPRRPVEAKP